MSEKVNSPTTKKKREKLAKKELPACVENISSNPTIEHGITMFDREEYHDAIEMFAVHAAKGDLLARQYLARCYYRLEKYNSAYRNFAILAESTEEKMSDYAVSMMATIEELRGNINSAIKLLRSLPPNPRNLTNLAVMYWKKYKLVKEEYSIEEALRIVRSLDFENLSDARKGRILHLKALIHQARKDYKLAESFYLQAVDTFHTNVEKAKVLNDLGSLYIETIRLDKAEKILLDAQPLIQEKSVIEMAFNNKWLGILCVQKKDFPKAKKHLEQAVQVLKDKQLLKELAGITYVLHKVANRDDFYEAAMYFADGLKYENLAREVINRDEKIIDLYFDSFFGRNSNSFGLG